MLVAVAMVAPLVLAETVAVPAPQAVQARPMARRAALAEKVATAQAGNPVQAEVMVAQSE